MFSWGPVYRILLSFNLVWKLNRCLVIYKNTPSQPNWPKERNIQSTMCFDVWNWNIEMTERAFVERFEWCVRMVAAWLQSFRISTTTHWLRRSLSSLKGTTLYSATKTRGFKSLFKYIALNWKSFLVAEQTINTSTSVNSRPSRPRLQSVGATSSQLWDESRCINPAVRCINVNTLPT